MHVFVIDADRSCDSPDLGPCPYPGLCPDHGRDCDHSHGRNPFPDRCSRSEDLGDHDLGPRSRRCRDCVSDAHCSRWPENCHSHFRRRSSTIATGLPEKKGDEATPSMRCRCKDWRRPGLGCLQRGESKAVRRHLKQGYKDHASPESAPYEHTNAQVYARRLSTTHISSLARFCG